MRHADGFKCYMVSKENSDKKEIPFKWLYSLVVEAGVEGSLSIFNHLSVTRSACIWVSMQVHLFDPVLFSCLFFNMPVRAAAYKFHGS